MKCKHCKLDVFWDNGILIDHDHPEWEDKDRYVAWLCVDNPADDTDLCFHEVDKETIFDKLYLTLKQ